MKTLTLLVPVSQVPDGEIVTKATGTKEYRVTRAVKIYVEAGMEFTPREISGEGVVFLVMDGQINAVPGTRVVKWEATPGQIREITALWEEEYTQ